MVCSSPRKLEGTDVGRQDHPARWWRLDGKSVEAGKGAN